MERLFGRLGLLKTFYVCFGAGIVVLVLVWSLSYLGMRVGLEGFSSVASLVTPEKGQGVSGLTALQDVEKLKGILAAVVNVDSPAEVDRFSSKATSALKDLKKALPQAEALGKLKALLQELVGIKKQIFAKQEAWQEHSRQVTQTFEKLRKLLLEQLEDAEVNLILRGDDIKAASSRKRRSRLVDQLIDRDYELVSLLKNLSSQLSSLIIFRFSLAEIREIEYLTPCEDTFKATQHKFYELLSNLKELKKEDTELIKTLQKDITFLTGEIQKLFAIKRALIILKTREKKIVQEIASSEVALSGLARKIAGEINEKVFSLAKDLKQEMGFYSKLIIFILSASILVTLLACYLVSKFLKGRLGYMKAFLARLSQGDFSIAETERIYGTDELAQVQILFTETVVKIRNMLRRIKDVSEKLLSEARKMETIAEDMASSAGQTETGAEQIHQAARETKELVKQVASSIEEITGVINEIAQNTSSSSAIAREAQEKLQHAGQVAQDLVSASEKIGEVSKLIGTIAEQTNLLALNATIEAARAGEAGKGFAVVANEVKELARQTGDSVEEIDRIVREIQTNVKRVTEAIETTTETMVRIVEAAESVAASIEEQSATVTEIGERAQRTSDETSRITKMTQNIAQAAEKTSENAQEVKATSHGLKEVAEDLEASLAGFRL